MKIILLPSFLTSLLPSFLSNFIYSKLLVFVNNKKQYTCFNLQIRNSNRIFYYWKFKRKWNINQVIRIMFPVKKPMNLKKLIPMYSFMYLFKKLLIQTRRKSIHNKWLYLVGNTKEKSDWILLISKCYDVRSNGWPHSGTLALYNAKKKKEKKKVNNTNEICLWCFTIS